jgi:hypothetical protein
MRLTRLITASFGVALAYGVALLVACIGAGYACGEWLGKTGAAAANVDRTSWADWGGIYGGLIGLGVAGGILVRRAIG